MDARDYDEPYLRDEFRDAAGSKILIDHLRHEVDKQTWKWNHIQTMVMANGFPSVAAVLVEVDRLRAAQTIKPHQIRELVNQLRDIAIKYHDHDSLRDRLSRPVMTLWRIGDEQQREEPL